MKRRALAEAWAPVIYQEIEPTEWLSRPGFSASDQIVDFFFDQNLNLRDSANSIYSLSHEQMEKLNRGTTLYYSVLETRSHFYLNYTVYHAVDLNGFKHANDTENIWMVVEKDGSELGKFVVMVTNAHGYPMIYALDAHVQSKWREQIRMSFGQKFLPYLDVNSVAHHEESPLEFVQRQESTSLKVFSARRSHALYKFRQEAYAQTLTRPANHVAPRGIFYFSKSCMECFSDLSLRSAERRIPYELVELEGVVAKMIHLQKNLNGSSGLEMAARSRVESNFPVVFSEEEDEPASGEDEGSSGEGPLEEEEVWNAGFQMTPSQWPRALAAGVGESRAAASLFHTVSFKTPYKLRDPASVHQFLAGSSFRISKDYLWNPYLNARDARKSYEDSSTTHLVGMNSIANELMQ